MFAPVKSNLFRQFSLAGSIMTQHQLFCGDLFFRPFFVIMIRDSSQKGGGFWLRLIYWAPDAITQEVVKHHFTDCCESHEFYDHYLIIHSCSSISC